MCCQQHVICKSFDRPYMQELLTALFDHLHVYDGQITGYTARKDREAEVLGLIEAVRRRVIKVGGDGLEPTTSSV